MSGQYYKYYFLGMCTGFILGLKMLVLSSFLKAKVTGLKRELSTSH